MEADRKEQSKRIAKLIAKVWSDEAFKESLFADPKAVLAAEGFTVPAGVDVKVLEQTAQQMYVVIPARPDDITVAELDQRLAAGYSTDQCCPISNVGMSV